MTVNMDKDYEDLYLSLDSLLKDICQFLETNTIHLSPTEKKKADLLIGRSKKQLQFIDKLSINKGNKECNISTKQLQETAEISNSNSNERYVDMTKKPDLPAKEASQEIKYGTLSKRRRVFNILDVSTKVYAVIHENWLLIYNSNKDLKPECALDLKQYEAKEDEPDPNLTQDEVLKKSTNNLKMASSFKVFHCSAEKKSYSFTATTHKDMLQWVVNINRRHDRAVSAAKDSQDELNYEICQDLQESEEENIYNEIEMPCRSSECRPISPKVDDRPAIPDKRPTVPKNVPPPMSTSPSIESMDCYEELEQENHLQNVSEKESLTSFETSGDEEDQTYYELDTIIKDRVNVKQYMEENINFDVPPPPIETAETIDDNENCTYENGLSIQTPVTENPPNKSASFDNKHPKLEETTTKPRLPEKNVPKLLTPKPKIVSPKPWKSFKKNLPSKNAKSHQVSKTKSSGESQKTSPKLENKLSLKESSCKDITPIRENSANCNTDVSKISSDACSLKPQQSSSIVRIIRNRWSTSQSPSCSLETFSRNTKIETFQASPTKESLSKDFLRSPTEDKNEYLRPVETLLPDITRNGNKEDEKPMVLLKSSLEDEDSSKKLKKSPVVPVKPKKVAKKLAL